MLQMTEENEGFITLIYVTHLDAAPLSNVGGGAP